jgi:hypothetical protein
MFSQRLNSKCEPCARAVFPFGKFRRSSVIKLGHGAGLFLAGGTSATGSGPRSELDRHHSAPRRPLQAPSFAQSSPSFSNITLYLVSASIQPASGQPDCLQRLQPRPSLFTIPRRPRDAAALAFVGPVRAVRLRAIRGHSQCRSSRYRPLTQADDAVNDEPVLQHSPSSPSGPITPRPPVASSPWPPLPDPSTRPAHS